MKHVACPPPMLLLLLANLFVGVVHGQKDPPVTEPGTSPVPPPPVSTQPSFIVDNAVGGMAYGTFDNKLYIQGGSRAGIDQCQFFALDLNKTWSISAPAWTSAASTTLACVSGTTGGFFVSGDFIIRTRVSVHVYSNNGKQEWTDVAIQLNNTNLTGQQIVTGLPDNQAYFMADGFRVSQNNNFTAETIQGSVQFQQGHAAVWSQERGAILETFSISSSIGLAFLSLNVSGSTYAYSQTRLEPTGARPPDRRYHCFVKIDGDNFLLFGGKNAAVMSDLWRFSLSKTSWTELTPAPSGGLHSAACAVAGTTLVVWGGFTDIADSRVGNASPLLYDIKTETWGAANFFPTVDTRIPVSIPTPTPIPGSPGATSGSSNNSTNIGAIIGGIAGCVVVLALIGFFLIRKRRQRSKMGASAGSSSSRTPGAEKEEFFEQSDRSLPTIPDQQTIPPRGGSPAAMMAYPMSAPMQQQQQQPPTPPSHSRPTISHTYVSSADCSGSMVVPSSRAFDEHSDVSVKHPLLTPIQYKPVTQHQPKPQEHEVIDLVPITRSEAGSMHSRANSVSSKHTLDRAGMTRTKGNRDALSDGDDDDEPGELDYL
ncbi:hypothetical protein BG004_000723 [Podila humilis]|nr:hypothetical protein BG004_000723 [Podila humilis]